MIRFSAALVVVAIGVLVSGMVASNLLLVYVAIGLSVAALATLALGVALKREEFFGDQGQASAGARAVSGQLAPVSQGANAGSGQQGAFAPQTAWATAPDMVPGRPGSPYGSDGPQPSEPRTGAPWSPPDAPTAGPRPEIPPWRKRFAPSVPQQPAAQTRVDAAQTRVDLAKTRTDLTEADADPAGADADPAPGRSAGLSWFERIVSSRPAGGSPRDDESVADASAEDHDDDIKTENADATDSPVDVVPVDAADAPTGDAHAEAAAVEDAVTVTAEDEDEAASTAEDEDEAASTAEDEAPGADATADAEAEDAEAEDAAEPSATEPSAAGADAEAADSSPDSDQENRSGQHEVTVVPGVPRYHDASCILIRFMGDDDLRKMTLDKATEAGCTPCRACMPEHA